MDRRAMSFRFAGAVRNIVVTLSLEEITGARGTT